MNVASATFDCVFGMYPYTWSKSNTMYGLQHRINTVKKFQIVNIRFVYTRKNELSLNFISYKTCRLFLRSLFAINIFDACANNFSVSVSKLKSTYYSVS